jgi:hypothetical protein
MVMNQLVNCSFSIWSSEQQHQTGSSKIDYNDASDSDTRTIDLCAYLRSVEYKSATG